MKSLVPPIVPAITTAQKQKQEKKPKTNVIRTSNKTNYRVY
jgi:hypothetical protein